jgi:hypothetical protein
MKPFDPKKKFGNIEEEGHLIYGEGKTMISSYQLNLPPDYYIQEIRRASSAYDKKKWYIRPHHIESLTNHANSIKDDFFNTRYISQINPLHVEDWKTQEVNKKEEALGHIEKRLEQLRMIQPHLWSRSKFSGTINLEDFNDSKGKLYHK